MKGKYNGIEGDAWGDDGVVDWLIYVICETLETWVNWDTVL
jgi:hypothetical protein